MMHEVIILPSAHFEIRDAVIWHVSNRPNHVAAWYIGLQKAIESLSEWPTRYALAYENDAFTVEVRQLVYGKDRNAYRILYTVRKDRVYVLHVRHAARAPMKLDETDEPPFS